MATQLKLSVEQILAAIDLLSPSEWAVLMKAILGEGVTSSAFDFWNDEGEGIYDDLLPSPPELR